MVAETWAVANAEGAEIDPSDPEGFVRSMPTVNAAGRTSMLQDVEAGRPTEHDAVQGAVLRAAARQGIEAPSVQAVHGLLAARGS